MGKRKSKGKQNDTSEKSRASEMHPANVSNEKNEPSKDTSWHNQVISEECDDNQFAKRDIDTGEFSNPKFRKNIDRDRREVKYSHSDGPRRSEPNKRSNQYEEGRSYTKRHSFHDDGSSRTDNFSSRRNYKPRNPNQDPEFLAYEKEFLRHHDDENYTKIREITKDLFEMSEEYSLAHCVAEDMNMGSGIAVPFRHKFKRVDELLNQGQSTGGLAILKDPNRYIYYLVTKKYSFGKPTYATLFSSLKCLREHVLEKEIKKIAIPRIGCGLDRLEWENVKFMVEFVFRDVDIEFVVCNLEPTEESPQQKHKNCKLTNELYPIQDIDIGTIILYFSSEDEYISDEMKKLDEKFHFLTEFRCARKSQGSAILYTKNKDYLLCGCIVKRRQTDPFDFVALQKCLQVIQKENRKYQFQYYAFQAFKDNRDPCINYKIINILRNSLRGVEVYVCWPGDLQNEMAYKDRPDTRDYKYETKEDWRNSSYRNRSPEERNKSQDSYRMLNDSLGNSSSTTEAAEVEHDWFENAPPQGHSKAESQPSHQGSYPTDNLWERNASMHNSSQAESAMQFQDTVPNNSVNNEFQSFKLKFESKNINCSKLNETQKLQYKYSLVCYCRENMLIESGVPVGKNFTNVIGGLLAQKQREGGLAVIPDGDNYWYCLITSSATSSPTSETMFSAIQKLREHITKNNVRNIVIPMMKDWGSSLTWLEVKSMFAYLLGPSQIDMTLASLEPTYSTSCLNKRHKNKLVHAKSAIHQMKNKTCVIYLASVDGYSTDVMDALARSIHFKDDFLNAEKQLGVVVKFSANEDRTLYGCVVRRQHNDEVDFQALQKCLVEVNRQNQKEKFPHVKIQAIEDQNCSVNYKIITLLLHCLQDVNIEMCWPGKFKDFIPK